MYNQTQVAWRGTIVGSKRVAKPVEVVDDNSTKEIKLKSWFFALWITNHSGDNINMSGPVVGTPNHTAKGTNDLVLVDNINNLKTQNKLSSSYFHFNVRIFTFTNWESWAVFFFINFIKQKSIGSIF